ncbi:hypothetical protein BT63DRAFT_420805 [Microthyrium microscopicum]|uniref:Protein ROT1 n=1 Tax=Microthyrium microscopicum TaxID=703497 RepID=A0A6A6ULC4_9PEZI|nr:hypothetical protein BT63DRAFT_420805 [Microthyrium microscopicum]
MLPFALSLLLLLHSAFTQSADTRLTGTWTTKSNSTLTGPAFYDSSRDLLIEPTHTGISYSFTDDGFYESAWYRAIANPQDPSCPSAMLQWQHGSYQKLSNGSLMLEPIAIDGRQLMSDPCHFGNAVYLRYNETETMKWYEVFIDPYHKIMRLNLYRFDGSPLPAMYLVSQTPTMSPTTTIHPIILGTATSGPTATRIAKRRSEIVAKFMDDVDASQDYAQLLLNPNAWWWMGLTLTGVGSVLYFCS